MSDPGTGLSPASTAARSASGRARRRVLPRRGLAELTVGARDPLGILDRQNSVRVPELIPLRVERMSQSPFAFYRGTAALMAADLAQSPHSGILVASCGDAHVSNFGFYASPQAASGVRSERLRRGRVGSVGVGRQAPGDQHRDRRAGDLAG
ncbi:DUF2252 domain-containing protein [Microbacterium elymi]|uniref:DUF2252 domain-containing protein n=1 Tax=Microbacterium elymi TaxID=2909587 RepID=A0ABY5NM68_9MICO|nr:DUF2252 domain-containing protein [Microbacterium elymi]UUT36290.1 DUF2252 domain-containing protein [Microbacterium elymi]